MFIQLDCLHFFPTEGNNKLINMFWGTKGSQYEFVNLLQFIVRSIKNFIGSEKNLPKTINYFYCRG